MDLPEVVVVDEYGHEPRDRADDQQIVHDCADAGQGVEEGEEEERKVEEEIVRFQEEARE